MSGFCLPSESTWPIMKKSPDALTSELKANRLEIEGGGGKFIVPQRWPGRNMLHACAVPDLPGDGAFSWRIIARHQRSNTR